MAAINSCFNRFNELHLHFNLFQDVVSFTPNFSNVGDSLWISEKTLFTAYTDRLGRCHGEGGEGSGRRGGNSQPLCLDAASSCCA